MNKPEMAVLFTAMKRLCINKDYEGLEEVIDVGVKESVTNPGRDKTQTNDNAEDR